MTADKLTAVAALSAASAIIAGAFGAHAATGRAVEWLQSGGSYQLIHAIAVVSLVPRADMRRPCWLLLGGSIWFALTLYLMALGLPIWLGALTPIGGLAMILGWIWVAISVLRRPETPPHL
jgi:uncharacterized membrane protein YgdD (TMEM256/DUF423 family)